MSEALSWVDQLLGFWFGELTYQQWFKRDDAVDAKIAERFGHVYDQIAALPLPDLQVGSPPTAREVLALIILLDQLPRNLYRGTPLAFATDVKALELSRRAIAVGMDVGLSAHERMFFYLPFEHSETLADQQTSVLLFSAIGDAELTRFAEQHRDIIARFGRFPHRNIILSRVSTAEEVAFLQEPGSSF